MKQLAKKISIVTVTLGLSACSLDPSLILGKEEYGASFKRSYGEVYCNDKILKPAATTTSSQYCAGLRSYHFSEELEYVVNAIESFSEGTGSNKTIGVKITLEQLANGPKPTIRSMYFRNKDSSSSYGSYSATCTDVTATGGVDRVYKCGFTSSSSWDSYQITSLEIKHECDNGGWSMVRYDTKKVEDIIESLNLDYCNDTYSKSYYSGSSYYEKYTSVYYNFQSEYSKAKFPEPKGSSF